MTGCFLTGDAAGFLAGAAEAAAADVSEGFRFLVEDRSSLLAVGAMILQ